MKVDNIYKKLEEVGNQIIDEMKAIITAGYKGRPAIASGNLLKSLSYDVYVDNGVWNLVIEYADYGKYVDKGRNPGRFPPKKDIENWARLKGIPQSAVYPIMVKIARGGFYSSKMGVVRGGGKSRSVYTPVKGLNFTSPLEKNLDLRKLTEAFGEAIVANIKEELNNFIKNDLKE
jgi:hypothetical protein